ncbi:MAG: DMT family transporter [Desulfobulbaceae bacterium]|nr:MAG: DMT family transporter [Desulfobulbaceae bacterium]
MNRNWLAPVSLVSAMLLWASSLIALKLAFQGFSPMIVILGRMIVGSLCFLPFYRRFTTIRIRRKDLKYLAIMALCEPCIYFIFEAKALQLTTASQAGIITAMLPLMVAMGAYLLLKESVTSQTIIGFSLAILGASLLSITATSTADAPNPLLGNFYEFLAMVAAAGYTLSLKHLSARYTALFLTAVQSFIGAGFFSLFLISPQINIPTEFLLVPTSAVIYLGSFVTLGAYFCYNFGVSQIPANQASAYINLIPVFSVMLGFLILGESFTTIQYVASGLVIAGVFISQKKPKPL